MFSRLFKPVELVIPLVILAFAGPANGLINSVFTATTRWAMLGVLALFLLFARLSDVGSVLRRPLAVLLFANAGWIILTIAWSDVPEVATAKGVAFLAVSVPMLTAGYSWVRRHSVAETFDFLWLFVVLALLASLSGELEGELSSGVAQYAGQTTNPNFLGYVLAVSSLWLIWRAYISFHEGKRWWFRLFCALEALSIGGLFFSHSRASLLMFFIEVVFVVIYSGNVRSRLRYLIPLGIVGVGMLALPATKAFVQQYISKTSLDSDSEVGARGVFSSREDAWSESWAQAQKGGLIGGGFGVTIGESFVGTIGASISSGQYGREHGNSQLALIEQTGWIGLAIYGALIVTICVEIFSGSGRNAPPAHLVAIGLLAGSVLGALIQSCFEAWWVAPGSVEFAIFWAVVGAFIAVKARATQERRQMAGRGPGPTFRRAAAPITAPPLGLPEPIKTS